MNNLYSYKPDYTVSLGDVISEYIESYEMTQTELSEQLEISQETMNAIIESQIAITHEIALKLQKVFHRPAHFWINLQNNYEQTLNLSKTKVGLGDRLQLLRKEAIKNEFMELLTTDQILMKIELSRGIETS